MSASSIMDNAASKTGWNADSQLAIALAYIDNQDSEDAFEDFVAEAVQEEIGCQEEE